MYLEQIPVQVVGMSKSITAEYHDFSVEDGM